MEWQPIDERVAILEFLRSKSEHFDGCLEQSEYAEGKDAACRQFNELFDAIERGEHIPAQGIETAKPPKREAGSAR